MLERHPEVAPPTPESEAPQRAPSRTGGGPAQFLAGLQASAGNSAVARMMAGGGSPLDAGTRSTMESRFEQSLADVRVRQDAYADRLAASAGAAAVTIGQNVFLRSGANSPTLLGHELTHTVQNARFGAGPGVVSRPGDAAEREADAFASGGGPVSVRATPTAAVSRSVLDWVEETASDAWSGVAGTVSAVGGAVWEGAEVGAGAVGSAASGAWDLAKEAGSGIYSGMKAGGRWIQKGEHLVGEGIDWLQDKEKAATGWMVEKTADIPVLGTAVRAGAHLADTYSEFGGGVLRGATGMVAGLAGMVVNPVDTVKGLTVMAEHVPVLGLPLKTIRGLINVAAGEQSWGDLAESLRPGTSLEQDAAFWKTVGSGFIAPYAEQWKKGKYADVAGRATFDIASLFIGAGEANAASKLGAATRLGETADLAKLADAAKLAEAAKLGEAAKVADAAELAKMAGAGDLAKAGEAAEVSRAAELTGMTVETLGGATDDLARLSQAELDAMLDVVDQGGKAADAADLSKAAEATEGARTVRGAGAPGDELTGMRTYEHGPAGDFNGPLTPDEVAGALDFEEMRLGPLVEAPAPDGLRLGGDQPGYWGVEPRTGMTVQEWQFAARRGLPKRDAAENVLPGPWGDAETRMRIHSPDPDAPAGSTSASEWTINFQQGDFRMTEEGKWFDKRFADTPAGRVDLRPYKRGPGGDWIVKATGAPVTEERTLALLEQWERDMASSHIPLIKPPSPPAP